MVKGSVELAAKKAKEEGRKENALSTTENFCKLI